MISSDFIKWLENNSFGSEGVDIFENYQPLDVENCITVYDVDAPELSESSSLSVDLYGLHIIVRNTNSQTAKTTLTDIHKGFMGFGGEKLNDASDNIISMVFIDQNPRSLGRDNKNRAEFEAMYNVRVESQNNAYRT